MRIDIAKMTRMTALVAALTTTAIAVTHASDTRELSNTEISALNFLLQCPKEVADVMGKAQWIGEGKFSTDRNGEFATYRFARQNGFTTSEIVAELRVSRIRMHNPPADHPGYKVECALEYL